MEQPTIDQAKPQSMTDRIAAQFDIPEDDEAPEQVEAEAEADETPEAEAPAEDVEIEYDGERFRVPVKLEKAIMQEADYTRKTQELAEQRRVLEQAQSSLNLATMEREFAKSVETEAQQITQLDAYLNSLKGQNFNEMPVDEGFRQWMLIQQASEQRETLQKAVETKRSEFMRDFESAVDTTRGKVRELLAKQIPGFSEAAVATMREYAEAQGFTKAAFDNIALDAKSMAVIYKAQQYDRLQEAKVSAVQKASPVLKPGSSNPMPQQVRDKLNYRKALKTAPNSKAKEKVILERLAGMDW